MLPVSTSPFGLCTDMHVGIKNTFVEVEPLSEPPMQRSMSLPMLSDATSTSSTLQLSLPTAGSEPGSPISTLVCDALPDASPLSRYFEGLGQASDLAWPPSIYVGHNQFAMGVGVPGLGCATVAQSSTRVVMSSLASASSSSVSGSAWFPQPQPQPQQQMYMPKSTGAFFNVQSQVAAPAVAETVMQGQLSTDGSGPMMVFVPIPFQWANDATNNDELCSMPAEHPRQTSRVAQELGGSAQPRQARCLGNKKQDAKLNSCKSEEAPRAVFVDLSKLRPTSWSAVPAKPKRDPGCGGFRKPGMLRI